MSIKYKLIILVLFLSLSSIIVSLASLQRISVTSSYDGIKSLEESKLISIRNTKKEQILDYFDTVSNILTSYAAATNTKYAANEFIAKYNSFVSESKFPKDYKEKVRSYYTDEYAKVYKDKNAGSTPNIDHVLSQLDDIVYALQYAYIADNENALGEKDKLVKANGLQSYNNTHAKFHSDFRTLLNEFGFYDIFIVDAKSGNIVYSVYKELDYATSLNTGPYADSGIGKVFKKALELEDGKTVMVDFDSYMPSYNDTASFMATPIVVNGKTIAVLVAQMPIDRINSIMTYNEKWKDAGLRDSGETYLVGPDFLMRSISRFLVEDKEGYLNLMRDVGAREEEVNIMDSKSTSIGIQKISTLGSQKALNGEEGFAIFEDYRGIPVLSAYTSIDLGEFKWALMSEIDEAEAFLPATILKDKMNYYSLVILLLVSIITTVIGYIASRYFASKIINLKNIAGSISKGNLDNKIVVDSSDEIGNLQESLRDMQNEIKARIEAQNAQQQLEQETLIAETHKAEQNNLLLTEVITSLKAIASGNLATKVDGKYDSEFIEVREHINETIDKLVVTVDSILSNTRNLVESAGEVSSGNTDLNSRTQEQAYNLENLSEQVKSISSGISDTSSKTSDVSKISQKSKVIVNEGGQVADNAVLAMSQIDESSKKIQNITGVIDDIAFQTNLLALNAAVEAARAGESGRGFAVVASEVRSLAQKSADSAKEIQFLINDCTDKVAEGSKLVTETKDSFSELLEAINNVADLMLVIASSSQEQSSSMLDIEQSVEQLNDITQRNADLVERLSLSSENMIKLTDNVRKSAGFFHY